MHITKCDKDQIVTLIYTLDTQVRFFDAFISKANENNLIGAYMGYSCFHE